MYSSLLKLKSLCAVATLAAASVLGQGTVMMANFSGTTFRAPVYGPEPSNPAISLHGNDSAGIPAGSTVYTAPRLVGVGYSVALYGGPQDASDNSLQICTRNGSPFITCFRTGTAAGFVSNYNTAIEVPGVGVQRRAKLQLRAWDNKGGTVTTYEAALAMNDSVCVGESASFISAPLGGDEGGGIPYHVAPNLIGISSFNIHLAGSPRITSQPVAQEVMPGTDVCFSVAASGNESISYLWRKNGTNLVDQGIVSGSNLNTLSLASVGPEDAGKYSVIVSNALGWVESDRVSLIVQIPPLIIEQPHSQIGFIGQSVTFNVQAQPENLAYQWLFNGAPVSGATNSSLQFNNVQASKAGTYSVVLSNALGTISSVDAILTVINGTPTFTLVPKSQNAAIGTTVCFSAACEGLQPISYQWQKNGVNLPGATNTSLVLSSVQMGNMGSYSVRATNPYGSTNSPVAVLQVGTLPSIFSQPKNRNAAVGQTASFTVLAGGSPPFSYQWRFNGADIAGATSSAIYMTVQWSSAGTYTVLVTNLYGSTSSVPAVLTVGTVPVITAAPQDQVAIVGQDVTFSVSATGTGTLSYQWDKDGVLLPGATTSSLDLRNVQITDSGSYSVVVSNLFGGRRPLPRAVLDVVTFQTTRMAMEKTTICLGSASEPVAEGETWYFNALSAPIANDERIGGASTSTLIISNLKTNDSGAYFCVRTNEAGRMVTAHKLQVLPCGSVIAWGDNRFGQSTVPADLTDIVAVSAGVNHCLALKGTGAVTAWGDNQFGQCNVPADMADAVSIAAGAGHSLALARNGRVFAWGDNTYGQTTVPEGTLASAIAAGDDHSIALLRNGRVVAWGNNDRWQCVPPPALKNVVKIAAGARHSLALTKEGVVYAWGDNSFQQTEIPDGLSDVVEIAASGNQSLALKRNGNIVQWGKGPQVPVGIVARSIAAGQSHGLALNTRGMVETWGSNHDSQGELSGQAQVPEGLDRVAAVSANGDHNLALILAPVIISQPESQTVGEGAQASFSVSALGANPLHYQWYLNGIEIPEATSATLTLQAVSPLDNGAISVRVKNKEGVVFSTPAQLIVLPPVAP